MVKGSFKGMTKNPYKFIMITLKAKNLYYMKPCIIVFFMLFAVMVRAQISPTEAGYIDAVADYGADNTGKSVTTTQLQNAIDAAIEQSKPLFIPAGIYLTNQTLVVENESDRGEQNVFITGSTADAKKRTIILLKEGTFPNAGSPGHVVLHKGWQDEKYTDTFNRMFQSIDIQIQGNNAGAIGLRWRGAEGCGVFDVSIDVTGGLYGMDMIPGSGGSMADISITGGRIGLSLTGGPTQPTPTITCLTLREQTEVGIKTSFLRGPLVLTGCKFLLNKTVPLFDLDRHRTFTQSPGGNPVLTDCVIEYDSVHARNMVIKMNQNYEPSLHFSDVYIKNAAKVLETDQVVEANSAGWRYFKEMAYNSQWDAAPQGNESIYTDGNLYGADVYQDFTDNIPAPGNIQSKHGWGETFPGFETPGAVNVKDYAYLADNGDWSPAFNAAIEAAASGSNVVFVPKGEYVIFNTIHLQQKTKLVGCGFKNSIILGRDMKNRRFGGSTSGWTDPKPMIDTPDDDNATCILADIAVAVNGPFNGESHTPEAMACYAIHWCAGNNSIIRNIDYMREMLPNTTYRAAWTLRDNLTGSGWLSLKSVASPYIIDGFLYTSDCAHAYHLSDVVESRILIETVASNKRLMTRSLPPERFNATETSFKIPNLTISKEDNAAFDISSLKITNAAWNPDDGDTVTIRGYGNEEHIKTIPLKGVSRNELQTAELNWTGITKVEITSKIPFSIDDVVIDNNTQNFEQAVGTKIAENTDFNHWCNGYGYIYLPMYMMAQPYVIISGGCKYYNHWIHGSTWLKVDQPYLLVKNNDPNDIVSFYHCHAQHSENFYKLKFENAYNVSVFGIKTENALEFIHAENSDNIRIMGLGGMTNPPKGTAHFRMENCSNFEIVSPTDQVYDFTDCLNCGLGDAMLPRTIFGQYDDIQEIRDGQLITPSKTHSPILYRRGNPHDPWGAGCTTTYGLNIENGYGSGSYCEGQSLTIRPELPDCHEFRHWTGDTMLLDDPYSATAKLIMPDSAVHISALIEELPLYTLTVINGNRSGNYCENMEVSVAAAPPAVDSIFSHWTGSGVEFLKDPENAATIIIQPAFDIEIIATYRKIPGYFTDEPITLPGSINLEGYDIGGEGVAYHDNDENKWGIFRPDERVDIAQTAGQDFYIGSMEAGEWLEYSVDCQAGTYYLQVVFASANDFGYFHLELDGQPLTDSIFVRNTGGEENFESVFLPEITLQEGEHIIRLVVDSGGFNLNYLRFCTDCAPFYTFYASGTNGTVIATPEQNEYLHGTIVELTAVPDEGYRFAGWTYGLSGDENPVMLIMDANRIVRAAFEKITAVPGMQAFNSFRVYPNPAKTVVYIKTGTDKGLLELLNAAGQVLKKISIYKPLTTISLQGISPGQYFLHLYAENRIPVYQKLIIL
jgi:hypothetical protein